MNAPFVATRGEPVWLLYRPPPADTQGWSDHPQTIAASALLSVRLTAILEQAGQSARIEGEVLDVLPLQALADRPGAIPGGLPAPEVHQSVTRIRSGAWELIDAVSEGDIGLWLLAHRAAGRVRLVAQGLWSGRAAVVWAGGLDADAAAWERLAGRMALRGGRQE